MNTVGAFGCELLTALLSRKSAFLMLMTVTILTVGTSTSQAVLTHRYSFTADVPVNGTTSDTGQVGGADGTLRNIATTSGGQLRTNNPNFSPSSFVGGYLSLPPSILPSSGSVTIEQWGTYTGSGFFTEAYTFTNHNNDFVNPPSNPPSSSNGQYLMHAVSAPQGGPVPAGGGSHVAQTLTGYGGGAETDAFGTTPGLGAFGGGYLDNGEAVMTATVIDGVAGTLSYYVTRLSDGLGGFQHTIPAIPLSSYSFTNAYLGRSAFLGDNWLSASVDEFRIYNGARSTDQIARDVLAGPDNLVPEPASLGLAVGAVGLFVTARRRRRAFARKI